MTPTNGTLMLRRIRALATAQCPSQQSDAQLLDCFIAERDEVAFAALVQRHGALVLNVCRSVLRHSQDAEDVFQAAFLVLARKAHTIRKHDALSSWLHGVAYRLSLKARARAQRRQTREAAEVEAATTESVDDLTFREIRAVLHEELNRLPEKYRMPLLLCYWEGKTRDEAAERLGVTSGAFKKYLERARNLLGSRLIGRGLAPSVAFFAALFFDNQARAAVSIALAESTAKAAVSFAAGNGAAGTTAAALALAEGAIRAMSFTKWATTVLTLAIMIGLGAGFGFAAYQIYGHDEANAVVALDVLQPPGGAVATINQNDDRDKFAGTWIFVDGRGNGEKLPAEFITLARLTFTKDGKMSMLVLDQDKKGVYKLIAAGKIDISKDGKDDLSPGIYKFDGNDRLALCFSEGAEPKRPAEFAAEKDSRQTLFTLRRAKPGEEKPTKAEIAKLAGDVDKIREAAARTVSANNLKQIGLAMHNHESAYKELPAHAIYSKDGKTPLLSWRVAILPFIGHEPIYKQFKLDEPWDSEHNKKLIPKMPQVYEPVVGAKKDAGVTYYQVFTGPNTVFDGAKKSKLLDIRDGTSNTIMAVEAKEPVIWTKPADLTLPKDKDQLPPMGGFFKNGFHILKCDGSVSLLNFDVQPAIFRAAVTPASAD